jgi:murein DD-endopeptidase MepM/ murein hydrolase activator NlpD
VTRFSGTIFLTWPPLPRTDAEATRASEEQIVDAKKLLPLLAAPAFIVFALVIAIVMLIGSLSSINADAAACALSPANSGADSASFAWPTDKHEISQDWADPDPNTGDMHSGMDFKVDEGSKVYAAADGTVASAADNEIVIKHEQEVQTHYKYLKSFLVHPGDKVKKGQQIATSGSGNEGLPGLSGAHLHFEVWIDRESNGHLQNTHMDDNPFVVQDAGESEDTCGCPGGDLSGSNNIQKAFNYLVSQGWSKEQAAGIVGNMISESGVEPLKLNDGTATGTKTQPADAVSKPSAWGIVQWYPAKKIIVASRNLGVDDKTIGTLAYQLDFLNKQLHGQGPVALKSVGDAMKATTTVDEAAYVFAEKFEIFTNNPNDPEYARRQANARHVFSTFAGTAPADPKGGTDPKAPAADPSGCGAGSGNIAAVAKNLAWPDSAKNHWSTAASAAKPEFVAAMAKYNDGPNGLTPYSDCGRFVATVLHMSGADPKFPNVGTGIQKSYMLGSDKWEHWESTPPGGMKPGDVLNGPGHTYLYVGPWGQEGGGFDAASGSLGQHVPAAGHLYDVGPGGFWVFRLKNGATPTTTPKN